MLPRHRRRRARRLRRRGAAPHRRATAADVPWGLTLSVGLAVTGAELARTPRRCCAPPPARCTPPSGSAATAVVVYDAGDARAAARRARPRRRPRAPHQLSAVLLLAETLDLRDAGTARHSRDRRPLRRARSPPRSGFDAATRRAHARSPASCTTSASSRSPTRSCTSPAALDDARVGGDPPPLRGRRADPQPRRPRDVAGWVLAPPRALGRRRLPARARRRARSRSRRASSRVADAYEAMTAARPYRPAPLSRGRGAMPSCGAAPARSSTPPWSTRSCAVVLE